MGAWGDGPYDNDAGADWLAATLCDVAKRIEQGLESPYVEEVRAAAWLLLQLSVSPYTYDPDDTARQAKRAVQRYDTMIQTARDTGELSTAALLEAERAKLAELDDDLANDELDLFLKLVEEPRTCGHDIKTVATAVATVYVGRRVGYTEHLCERSVLTDAIAQYCDEVGLCVSVTDTEFIYTGGAEPGIAVGLINYPRFPSGPGEVLEHAMTLARILGKAAGQYRVSVVTGDTTHTIQLSN